jgi:hypothetical protein
MEVREIRELIGKVQPIITESLLRVSSESKEDMINNTFRKINLFLMSLE